MHAFIHSHSFGMTLHSLTHSLTHWLAHSLARSLFMALPKTAGTIKIYTVLPNSLLDRLNMDRAYDPQRR